MAAVLERIAQAVNWPRLLAEASFRHALVHGQEDEKGSAVQNPRWKCPADEHVCGE
ncbi:hypothetical protein ACIBBE_24290 [Streptomyces sp. NPDC051644]|uniref:hypothetical protein n=1 Tax=Streptomyces sp. NPDC051644 TaxID=3365666 RepID=UPI0037A8F071